MDKTKKWRGRLARAGHALESRADRIRQRLGERFEDRRIAYVQPYRWYSSTETVTVRGRALYNNGLAFDSDDAVWDNLLNAYRRFNSDEIAHAELTVHFGDKVVQVQADEEGYFEAAIALDVPLAAGWHSAEINLDDGPVVDAPFLVVNPNASIGIISDVDDTILQTHATNLLRAAQLTLLGNARTRLSFAGVAALYQGLSQGGRNPLFYVSSSPWNLYDLLSDFIDAQGIPAGPLCLRDLGIDRNKLITTGHGSHKLAHIEQIMTTYPTLPFILIGDSGQHDPEIYAELAARYPGSVRAVYIRDVTDGARDVAVTQLAEASAVPFLLIENSLIAAQHAATQGWLTPEQVAQVAADIVERDDLLTV